MRIYISGPITGVENYAEHFEEAEAALGMEGMEAINPAKVDAVLPDGLSYEDHMRIDLTFLDICAAIYMLRGWERSLGANREYGYALGKGLKILYEQDQMC